MSHKKQDHPEYYARKVKEKKNPTHSIHSWGDWCEICDEYGEDPHLCFEITLEKAVVINYECFEYDGDIPKMD